MFTDTASLKVTAAHLTRQALLYIRQSSLKQVLHNTESAIRQYDLRGKAIALGWTADQITVIDIDQGQSGASAADREGFQQLVAEASTSSTIRSGELETDRVFPQAPENQNLSFDGI
jgi:hypothetical protein